MDDAPRVGARPPLCVPPLVVDVKELVLALLLVAAPAHAWWVVVCNRPTGFGFIDPIVAPGVPSTHRHEFHGAQVGLDSTIDDILAGLTSCHPIDHSGYWFPPLYKDGVLVLPKFVRAYLRRSNLADEVVVSPFPQDLRVVARRRAWRCPGLAQGGETIPYCGGGEIRLDIAFTDNCWDRTLTGVDDSVHLIAPCPNKATRYLSPECREVGARHCPLSNPVALPLLDLAIQWKVGQTSPSRLSVASDFGAAPGSTMHADFWAGWDDATQADLVAKCLVPGHQCGYICPSGPCTTNDARYLAAAGVTLLGQ